jgi:uncharacterized protein YjbJ (UPF0337 family)
MSSTSDKASGLANEAIGNIKQGIGTLVGSEKLQAQGKVQEIKGEGQQALGDAKAATKKGAQSASDYLNKKL